MNPPVSPLNGTLQDLKILRSKRWHWMLLKLEGSRPVELEQCLGRPLCATEPLLASVKGFGFKGSWGGGRGQVRCLGCLLGLLGLGGGRCRNDEWRAQTAKTTVG